MDKNYQGFSIFENHEAIGPTIFLVFNSGTLLWCVAKIKILDLTFLFLFIFQRIIIGKKNASFEIPIYILLANDASLIYCPNLMTEGRGTEIFPQRRYGVKAFQTSSILGKA